MTAIEKIILATNTINLLAIQLHVTSEEKRVLNHEPLVTMSDSEVLEDCIGHLKDALERLTDHMNNHDLVDSDTYHIVNNAYLLVNDRGEEAQNEE